MNIQNINSINFGAARVLTASKGEQVIDVFRLNRSSKNDINFIKRCKETLTSRKAETSKPKMEEFFNSFLDKDSSWYEEDYYIGIKNGEILTGGFSSYAFSNNKYSHVRLNRNFTNIKDKLAKDCLLYSLLADSQKSYKGYRVIDTVDSAIFRANNIEGIEAKDIDKTKKMIEDKYPKYEFEEGDNQETDLENLLGIGNIESRILL